MKRLLGLMLAIPAVLSAQAPVTVTLTNTVKQANAQRTSMDIGALYDFGNGSVEYADPFYPDGATIPAYYNQTSWKAQGTGMTTTSWPTGFPQSSSGYPANFFAPGGGLNATYEAHDGITGAILGTGTITASSAANGSVGPTFTLSAALSRVPVSNQDVLFVRLTASSSTYMTPLQLFSRTGVGLSGTCAGGAGLVFETADLDPNSLGVQTMDVPAGCTIQFNSDQSMGNSTNPVGSIASVQMNNRPISGAYKAYLGIKCPAASGNGSFTSSVFRSGGQTFVASHTITPPCNSGNGLGWVEDAPTVTAGTETVPPLGNLIYAITFTTAGKFAYAQFPQVTSGSNHSAYSDKYFNELLKLKLQKIRDMDASKWPSTIPDQMAEGGSNSFPEGTQRWGNVSNYLPYQFNAAKSYPDTLKLANELGTGVVFTTSYFNPTSQYATFGGTGAGSLAANTDYQGIAAAGNDAELEIGNEAFNSLAGGFYGESDGEPYGALLSSLVLAFKGGAGYDSVHMKTIGNGWFTSGQLTAFGWSDNVCKAISSNGGGYPNFLNFAPYNFKELATFTTSGANLGNSGEPSAGMAAEIANFNSATPPSGSPSMQVANSFLIANCGAANSVQSDVYEHGSGNVVSVSTTQLQTDQSAAGIFQAVLQDEHDNLMQRDSGVAGYLGLFALTDSVFNGNSCSGTCSAPVSPVWDIEGPGMVIERPSYFAVQMRNTALSTLSTVKLVNCPQTGTTTYNYPGGQAGTIGANTAVSYLNATCFTDSANHWVVAIDNVDPVNAYPITFAGIPPTGAITQYSLGAANGLWDQNEGTYLGPSSISPLVTGFATTTVSGTPTAAPHTANYFSFSTGANWYVLKGATGTNAGTSWTNAWNELSSINWSSVACGDIVWLGGGTYTTSTTITKTCTSVSPLTVQSVLSSDTTPTTAPGYTTAVLNQVIVSNSSIDFNGGAYTTLSGRKGTIGTSSSFGISMQCPSGNGCGPITVGTSTASSNITLTYLELYGPPCVTSGGSGEGTCTDGTHAVDHGLAATTNLLMDHMWMHRFAEIVRPYQWTNYTIQYSDLDTTRETPAEHEDLMYAANPTSGTMRYNILWGSPNDGLFFDQGGNSLNFYGNVYYNSGGGYMIWDNDAGPNGVLNMYNNTFSSDESFGDFICPSNCPWIDWLTTFSSVTIENNIFDHVTYSGTPGTGNYNAYSTDIGKQDSGANSFTYVSAFAPSNTQFLVTSTTNPISANYRLTSSGQTTFANGITLASPYTSDPDGNTRGTGGSWTIGAYQTVGTPTLAAPTFSPGAGTYATTQTVTIGCASGATCVYTTDGSTPTAAPPGTPTHGTVYTTPITVSSSQTINAIATEVGFFNSSVASAAYVIAPPAATPTFSPVAGTYTSAQTVTISTTTPSPTIHYTTDGSTPTLASPLYTGPITVSVSETVKAIATASGFSSSPVGTASYVINLPTASAPTFSPVAGTYATAQSVSLSTTTSGGVICYKIGSAPPAPTTAGVCPSGTGYATPIFVSASQTIFAYTTAVSFLTSTTSQAAYVIEVPASTPTFSPGAGTYTSVQTVNISSVTPGATIFYSFNCTVFTSSPAPPISVSGSGTVCAYATAPGFTQSVTGSAAYVINLPPAATPTFAPPAGTYTSVQNVTLASTTAGAFIFYTTDGSTPTPSSTLYTGPISVGSTQTINAIATATGFSNSAVGTALYTINLPQVSSPTFSPPSGTYSSTQTVTISSTTAGASIYYTTNGSTPTPSSTLYTGPITVASSQTVRAIGVLSGLSNSLVGSAAYTITATTSGCRLGGTLTIRNTVTLKCPQ